MKKNLHENYVPQYFLASLGFGGMAVTFFMYLMFMTEHKQTPIPTFETLLNAFSSGNIWIQGMILVALAGIIAFSAMHLFLLFWNIKEFSLYQTSENYKTLQKTNGEVGLMAPYLTLAMTVNVGFILGAVFIPNLWSVVEYLFPGAVLAFFIIGVLALNTFGKYMGRILSEGMDFEKNNNLNQLMSAMTFAMVSVGLAASAAMSQTESTVAIALITSIFFGVISAFLLVFFGTIGLKSILKKGIQIDTAASIWVMIPILTLLGIMVIRNMHGMHFLEGTHPHNSSFFLITSVIFSLQIFFLYVGYQTLKKIKFFEDYVFGKKETPQAFAIICPGVAFVVFGFFFLHQGLVKNEIVEKFSLVYFLILAILIYAQAKTAHMLLVLTKKNIHS